MKTQVPQAPFFIFMCMVNQQVATTSLTQLISQLETSTGVLLSPEGLNRRFNSASVAFFINCTVSVTPFSFEFYIGLIQFPR